VKIFIAHGSLGQRPVLPLDVTRRWRLIEASSITAAPAWANGPGKEPHKIPSAESAQYNVIDDVGLPRMISRLQR